MQTCTTDSEHSVTVVIPYRYDNSAVYVIVRRTAIARPKRAQLTSVDFQIHPQRPITDERRLFGHGVSHPEQIL